MRVDSLRFVDFEATSLLERCKKQKFQPKYQFGFCEKAIPLQTLSPNIDTAKAQKSGLVCDMKSRKNSRKTFRYVFKDKKPKNSKGKHGKRSHSAPVKVNNIKRQKIVPKHSKNMIKEANFKREGKRALSPEVIRNSYLKEERKTVKSKTRSVVPAKLDCCAPNIAIQPKLKSRASSTRKTIAKTANNSSRNKVIFQYLNDCNEPDSGPRSTNETCISLEQLFNFSAEKLIKMKRFNVV